MHLLFTSAALLLHAPLPPESFWPQTLADCAQVASGVAVLLGGYLALRTYRHGQRLKAAEILMQMEEEFRVTLPAYELIDDMRAYRKELEPVLNRLYEKADLEDGDVPALSDLDRCLRFLFLCAVLNKDLGVEGNALLRSYYYYAGLLAQISDPDAAEDDETRERAREMQHLAWYLKKFYPRLCKWVKANRKNLLRLREGKSWRKEYEPSSFMEEDD